ncbi:AfsR/SARP family transcriptional regulator [Micromonospora sp. NPDC007271]|uniref:AfsR/SARP family transcriptional regulator n=1 Tax=Micromonospora sp. NPDC007271 TaxID=3154587 RepID=UPI0033C1340C
MDFRLLGPVELRRDNRPVGIGGVKARTVLASLLLTHGSVASDSWLRRMLWGDEPPSTAYAQLPTYISGLRRACGDACQIVRQVPGYVIHVDPERLDLLAFRALAEQGRDQLRGGSIERAAHDLRAALALWRGPALFGVTDHLIDAARARLEEERLSVLEERVEADLALGRHAELAPELTWLLGEHPQRERLRAQLMRSLSHSGRQAEAHSVFQEGRRLAEASGADPGPLLTDAYELLMSGQSGTGDGAPAERTTALLGRPAPMVRAALLARPLAGPPAELPAAPYHFVGHAAELDRARAQLRETGGGSASHRPAGLLVTGMAGVGKTALALRAAHLERDRFPDGQLYADLRGSGSDPADPADVLVAFLNSLGVSARLMPPPEERGRLYRTLLAGRRVLVFLDDATERQVRPLLPGQPESLVVVTGRARMASLDGLLPLDLGTLTHAEAAELLGRLIGVERCGAEPEATRSIVKIAGCLPLAVRAVAARIAARPHYTLARFVQWCMTGPDWLRRLRGDHLDVERTIMSGYETLDEPARRMLRRLSLLNRSTLEPRHGAEALNLPVAAAEELMESLVDARLLDAVPADRGTTYRFHRLVWECVRLRASAEEPKAGRSANAEIRAA